jgi:hypothetical protein
MKDFKKYLEIIQERALFSEGREHEAEEGDDPEEIIEKIEQEISKSKNIEDAYKVLNLFYVLVNNLEDFNQNQKEYLEGLFKKALKNNNFKFDKKSF